MPDGGYGSGFGRGRSSSGYGSGFTRTPAKPKKPKGPSVLGFIGNLAGDVEDAIVGLGPGLYKIGQAATHDFQTVSRGGKGGYKLDDIARSIGASYSHTYSPLLHGDVGEFGHRFYENPLGPLLDATAFLSGGASLAAKAGIAPAALKRGFIELQTPAGQVIRKPLPRQTLRAEMQVGVDELLKKIPADRRFGEYERSARALRKPPQQVARSRELMQEPFLRALGKVRNKDQRLAAFWLTQVPNADDLGRLVKVLEEQGSETALATATMLRRESFLEAYLHPTPKMQRAIDEASGLSEAQRVILGISEDAARQRAYLPTLLARGATFVRSKGERVFVPPPPGAAEKVTRPRTLEEASARAAALDDEVNGVLDLLANETVRANPGRFLAAGGGKSKTRVVPEHLIPRYKSGPLKGKPNLGRMPEGEYVEASNVASRPYKLGIEQARDWVEEQLVKLANGEEVDPWISYLAEREPRLAEMSAKMDELHGLKTAVRQHQPEASIFEDLPETLPELGDVVELVPAPGFASVEDMIRKIDADLDAAGRPRPIYMPHISERPRISVATGGSGGRGPQRNPSPLHQTMGILLSKGQVIADPSVLRGSFISAVKFRLYSDIHRIHVEQARRLPKGEMLPKGWGFVRKKHGDRFPYTAKTGSEFKEWADEYLDDLSEPKSPEAGFLTDKTAEAMSDKKGYLIVPESFSKEMTGEFVRANRFLTWMNRNPIRVWRHLVLKLRPAWLVNNMVGNSFLYLMATGSVEDIRALGATLRRMTPKRKRDAFDKIMHEHFPEQVHGTFIGSQLPIFPLGSKGERFERVTSILGAGIAQADRFWEQSLRSAKVMAALKRSPELRAFAGKMRRQTDEFWKLADEELARNPQLIERVTSEVNDALGDFLSMGRLERDVLRAVFPFYAWYRVITLITLKLPVTHPLKAMLLSRVGQVGAQSALEELGLSDDEAINLAKGFIGIGKDEDGRTRGFSTTSINPLATVAELEDSVAALSLLPLYMAGAKQPDRYQAPAWQFLPGVNPIFAQIIQGLTGVSGRSGNRFGLLGEIPQAQLGLALSGKGYQGTPQHPTLYDRDPLDALLRYFGVPYARISPTRVKEIARK